MHQEGCFTVIILPLLEVLDILGYCFGFGFCIPFNNWIKEVARICDNKFALYKFAVTVQFD